MQDGKGGVGTGWCLRWAELAGGWENGQIYAFCFVRRRQETYGPMPGQGRVLQTQAIAVFRICSFQR